MKKKYNQKRRKFIKNKIIKSLIKYTYSQADRVLVNSTVLKSELKEFSISEDFEWVELIPENKRGN